MKRPRICRTCYKPPIVLTITQLFILRSRLDKRFARTSINMLVKCTHEDIYHSEVSSETKQVIRRALLKNPEDSSGSPSGCSEELQDSSGEETDVQIGTCGISRRAIFTGDSNMLNALRRSWFCPIRPEWRPQDT